jgi:hypothetical protein
VAGALSPARASHNLSQDLGDTVNPGRSDEGTLHPTGVARSEVRSVAEHGLELVGFVGGDDGIDLAPKVDDEAGLLLRSLRVEVGPVPRVACSPDAPLAGPDTLDLDALETLDLRVRDALGTEREVVGVNLQPVGAAHDRAVVVGVGHIRPLSCGLHHQTITLINDAPQVEELDTDTAASAGVPHPLWIVPAGDGPVNPVDSAATLGGLAAIGRGTRPPRQPDHYTVLSKVLESDKDASRVSYLYRITEGEKVISEEELTESSE